MTKLDEQTAALLTQSAQAHQKGDLPRAVVGYGKILERDPANADAWNNLGVALRGLKRFQASVSCYRRSIALRPRNASTYANMGNVLRDLGRVKEAVQALEQAITLAPDTIDHVYNLGLVLRDMARNEEALVCFDKVLADRPDHVDCLWDRALSQLLLGDLKNGFVQYEWRWHLPYHPPRGFAQGLWDGGELNGKTILLHHEQGLGDSLNFIRFAPQVKARGGTVIVECQPELARLFETAEGVDQVIPGGAALPAFDVYAPLLSLGAILGVTEETIPRTVPYLSAPNGVSPPDVERIRRAKSHAFSVGISWGGKPSHKNDRNRSVAFSRFLGLTEQPETRFFSLQKGPPVQEMIDQACPSLVDDVGSNMADFADSAAAVEALDLVITVDTSLAHLAGAMGKPVWVLVPFAPDWRWQMDRPDTPWYPTMRLFRQSEPGDWDSVFDRIAAALKTAVANTP